MLRAGCHVFRQTAKLYINIMQMVVGFRIVLNYKLVECCGGSDSKVLL